MLLETLLYSREQRWFSKHSFTHENIGGSRNVGVLAVQSPDVAASPRKVYVLILLLVNNIKNTFHFNRSGYIFDTVE